MTSRPARIVRCPRAPVGSGTHRLVSLPLSRRRPAEHGRCLGHVHAASTSPPTWPSPPAGTSRSWSTSPQPLAGTRSTRPSSLTGELTSPAIQTRSSAAFRPRRRSLEAVAAVDEQLAAPRLRGVRPKGVRSLPSPARCASRPPGPRAPLRGDDPSRSTGGNSQGARASRRPRGGRRTCRAGRGTAPMKSARSGQRASMRSPVWPQRAVQALRPGHAPGIDVGRSSTSVARVRHRRIRGRSLLVRSNFPVDGMHGTFDELLYLLFRHHFRPE